MLTVDPERSGGAAVLIFEDDQVLSLSSIAGHIGVLLPGQGR